MSKALADAESSGVPSRTPRLSAVWPRAVVIVVIVLVVLPAVRGRDSFPLSTYPVYASVRPRQATFATAFGERSDGTVVRLSMEEIADTDDPLVAQQRVADAIDSDRASELCTEIAQRVSGEVVTVVVARERHDVVRAAHGSSSLIERTPHVRCRVGR